MKNLLFFVVVLLSFMLIYGSQTRNRTQPNYPTAIKGTSDNQFLVSNKGDKTVVMYSADFEKILRTWQFKEIPTGIATFGDYAFVTTFETTGKVNFLNLKTGEIEKSLITGLGARAPVLSPDGTILYVLNQFQNTVTKIDITSREVLNSVEVLREPYRAVTDLTGQYLFVNNYLPAQNANADNVAACVSVIDTEKFTRITDIQLTNGSNALSGIALGIDGNHVFVIHTLARFGLPTNQIQQGWINTNALSIIDVKTLTQTATVLLDDPENGAAGAWDIQTSADKIVVTHSGSHEISVIDYTAFMEKLGAYNDKSSLNYDLRFMQGIRQRIPVTGNGPRDFIIAGGRIFITTYFSDIINSVCLQNGQNKIFNLNPNRMETSVDMGERIFHDASYCLQNWQSCQSCHPGSGRTDGLNWDLLNDGLGNPKNTKSLLYSHQTPPVMISGIRANAEMAVRAGFKHIQFAEIPEDMAVCVDAYLESLRPAVSPYLVEGKLSVSAERGKKVFEKHHCGTCHSGPYYTDMKMHRIGDDVEFEKGWDTPALTEVWRTAPYLFDGRAATMKDVFKTHRHGIQKKISDRELNDLVEFVNSL
jgi:YVTN family beta-propeller protein